MKKLLKKPQKVKSNNVVLYEGGGWPSGWFDGWYW